MCCLTLIERYRLRTSHYWHIPLKSQRLPRVSSPQIQSTSLIEGMQAVLGFLLPFPSCLFHTLASSSGKSTLLRLLILSLHAYIYVYNQARLTLTRVAFVEKNGSSTCLAWRLAPLCLRAASSGGPDPAHDPQLSPCLSACLGPMSLVTYKDKR